MKKHSCNLHAPLCGIFCPNSVVVARYDALIRTKSPTNCDAHLAESLFQTRSSESTITQTSSAHQQYLLYTIRACTGFDGGFEVVEAIRSLPNCVITGNSKYKRWRSVSNGSLSAARQSCCTHTSGVWRRPCEKPCRVSFAPVDVSWSYWSSKPVGGRAVEGMLIQRLWWEMPQGIDFRTRVQFPPGPLNAICIQIQLSVTIGKKAWRSLENVEYSMFPGLF